MTAAVQCRPSCLPIVLGVLAMSSALAGEIWPKGLRRLREEAASPFLLAKMNSLTIAHSSALAWSIRPDMLPLVSSRIAIWTSGFSSITRSAADAVPTVQIPVTIAARSSVVIILFIFFSFQIPFTCFLNIDS